MELEGDSILFEADEIGEIFTTRLVPIETELSIYNTLAPLSNLVQAHEIS